MLAYVWAEDKNHLIGNNGQLPWHLPNDLQFFKELTTGSTIVMGRQTFEGMGKRLLPNRHTIILTSDEDYDGAGAEVCTDFQTIIEDSQAEVEDIYIVGGRQIYQLFADEVAILYRTVIDAEFVGDCYFPEIDWSKFALMKAIEGTQDEDNQYPHTFEIYQRINA